MSNEVDECIVEKYDIKKRVGKGAYGIVWKAIDRESKKVVAVKKIFDAFRNQTDAQRTFREIMFLRAFSGHPHIVQLLAVHPATNNSDMYLIFEYMDTDLHNVVKRGNILKDIHVRFIMYQLFKAVDFLHCRHVIHRDLKPSNILLDGACNCKLADFGLARSLTQLDASAPQAGDPALTDYVATRWYRAPEILIASKRYTAGIDLWSLGCILGEMLLSKPLFPGNSTIHQIELIMSTLPTPSSIDLASVSAEYGSHLLKRRPPGPRRSLATLLQESPADSADLAQKLLHLNPQKRITAREALTHPFITRHIMRYRFTDGSPEEVVCEGGFSMKDDIQLTVEEYRTQLYHLAESSCSSDNRLQQCPQSPSVSVTVSKESRDTTHHREPPQVHPTRERDRKPKTIFTQATREVLPATQHQNFCKARSNMAQPRCVDEHKTFKVANHSNKQEMSRTSSRIFKTAPPTTYTQQRLKTQGDFNSYSQAHGIITQSALAEIRRKITGTEE